jgi:uncharacterized membrane protein HdeD (DUF308 family)
MLKTLIQNWWLLALRGVLALALAAAAFTMRSSADTFTLREFAMKGMVVFFGMLAVAAGACTAGAGIWNSSKGKWWLLILDGLVLGALGFILILANRFSFHTLTQIIAVLAAIIGVVEVAAATHLRRHMPDEWFLALAGIASIGFAIAFLLVHGEEAASMFTWLGAYSGFSALCMLGLALRLRRLRSSIHHMAQSASHGH